VESESNIKPRLRNLPTKPGVYRFFDRNGDLLYVGKAKNLKARVSSYFSQKRHESAKTTLLVKKTADLKVIVVENEYDALLLENTLIKKHRPPFNIRLKDDKTYPWIVIKKEPIPRIFSTRKKILDGSEYFGPFVSGRVMHSMLDLIKSLFPLRTCKLNLSPENVAAGKFKVCLEYHLGNCLGPCTAKQTADDYDRDIAKAREILKGNITDILREMRSEMELAAAELRFEEAARWKEKLGLLEQYRAKSLVVHPSIDRVDVFGIVSDSKAGYVNHMRIRNGAVIHSHTLELRKQLDETEEDMLRFAIFEMRAQTESDAREILTNIPVEWEMPGIQCHAPVRGDKRKLAEMSEKNAKFFMMDLHKQQDAIDPEASANRIMETLQNDLGMDEMPRHIECFDNSNIQGTNPASACVVFKNAKPAKDDYRKFNIRTVDGPNDFASMEEVVERRYRRLTEENSPLPQLIIIDGGKGQLGAAVSALERLDLGGKVTVIGIAKRLEEIYFPGDPDPLYIDKRSESLKLIQQLRNEAHRFSLAHHRNLRSKSALTNELSVIPGIGPRTADKLIARFRSLKQLRMAKAEDIEKTIGKLLAKKVLDYLNNSQ
jgi:excinuclease ABC subunit C